VHWSLDLLLMPFHKLINRHGPPDAPIGAHMWVPIDDENCIIYSVEYHPHRPLQEAEMKRSTNLRYIHMENIPGSDHCHINKSNDYLVDRKLQSSGASFNGMKGLCVQDCGIQESMGPIAERTREHLGRSDLLIIQLRRLFLRTLSEMEVTGEIIGADARAHRVRSACASIPTNAPLKEALYENIQAAPPCTA